MGPPPGGPVDKRPPSVLETVPSMDSTNVDPSSDIEILFSEEIRRTSLRDAFSLSPPPTGTVRSSWKGRRLILHFDPPLKDDRTYVLTLGTGLSDMHGNQVQEAIHLAFSTGDRLDQGNLYGRLKAEGSTLGWNVFGYLLNDSTRVDSTGAQRDPDPSRDLPDATTQANADGTWNLLNLREGNWRVFAFNDQDKDRLWTPWLEPIAVPPFDVEAREDSTWASREVVLIAAKPHLLPEPNRVVVRVRDVFDVQFDHKPSNLDALFTLQAPPKDLEDVPDSVIASEDKDIRVRSASYKPADSTVVRLHLDRMAQGGAVWLRIQGRFGTDEKLDTTMTVLLKEAASVDTFPPNLLGVTPEQGSRLHEGKSTLDLLFSEPMGAVADSSLLLIQGGTDTLLPHFSWSEPERMVIPVPPMPDGGNMTLQLFGDGVHDKAGNAIRDSLLSYNYIYLPADSLGTVSGKIEGDPSARSLHLYLIPLNGKEQQLDAVLTAPVPFRFDHVPAGAWRTEAWGDRNGNDIFDTGTPFPFKPADPYTIMVDTIWVRARWESGSVQIIFP